MYDGHGRWRSENTGVRVTPGFTLTLQYKNPEVRVLRFNPGSISRLRGVCVPIAQLVFKVHVLLLRPTVTITVAGWKKK